MSTDEQKQAAREALAKAVFGTSRSSAPVKPAAALVLGLQSGAGRAFSVKTPKQRAVDALRGIDPYLS